MKTALIISLNFNPGHVSHLVASYRQCKELGYDSVLYIHKAFEPYIPAGYEYVIYGKPVIQKINIAVFLFPSEKNILQILKLKWYDRSKVIYIFHEPLGKFSLYRDAGFTGIQLFKLSIINLISAVTVKLADIILLPSKKALKMYDENKLYRNQNRYYLPLMYDDEAGQNIDISHKFFFLI